MKFEIKPLEGIYWDDKDIQLGDNKDKVINTLGQAEVYKNTYYYYNSELSIHFNKNEKVEYIEFLGGIDGNIQPIIYDIFVFNTEAEKLYQVLSYYNDGEVDDSENGYSYAFKNTSVGIYRPSTPESLNEMIEEMKSEGIDIENNEDIEFETKQTNYFQTIGIGNKGYYNNN